MILASSARIITDLVKSFTISIAITKTHLGSDLTPSTMQVLIFAIVAIFVQFSSAATADGLFEDSVPLTSRVPGMYIEVLKSDQILRLRHGTDVFREYPIAFGRGDRGPKERIGDNKTPEGIYRIVGVNQSERFHLFLRLNYPNVKDAFYGLKNKLISRTEFDSIINALKRGRLPPQDTALGGAIGIHGVGMENGKTLKIHANMNWTEGCIAVTNAEINELSQLVRIGTEVVIKP